MNFGQRIILSLRFHNIWKKLLKKKSPDDHEVEHDLEEENVPAELQRFVKPEAEQGLQGSEPGYSDDIAIVRVRLIIIAVCTAVSLPIVLATWGGLSSAIVILIFVASIIGLLISSHIAAKQRKAEFAALRSFARRMTGKVSSARKG